MGSGNYSGQGLPGRPDASVPMVNPESRAEGGRVALRLAKFDDVPDLASIEREAFGPSAWSEVSLREELAGHYRHYVVACQGDRLLGYAGVFFGDVAEVMTIAVSPPVQGRGIGRRLMMEVMRAARAYGLARVLLEVRVDNEPAIALYTSLGFRQISLRRRYYQPEDVDALVMEIHLPDVPA